MLIDQIRTAAPQGTVIPKPEAKSAFTVKGWGKRRGQEALIYYIPNHANPRYPYQKGIAVAEFEMAHARLLATGEFTRAWFDAHLPDCAKEGGCNFTTIGGIFQLLGIATRARSVPSRLILVERVRGYVTAEHH